MSAADTITLAVAGDFWVNRPLPRDEPRLETVLDRLRAADISVCVLEMPLSRRGAPAEKIVRMRGAPERAKDLHHLGVDCVTIATNHCSTTVRRPPDTLEVLKARIPFGGGRDIEERPIADSRGEGYPRGFSLFVRPRFPWEARREDAGREPAARPHGLGGRARALGPGAAEARRSPP